MLTLSRRADYLTLLDAACLRGGAEPALIYVATDAEPITLSAEQFRAEVERFAGQLHSGGIRPRDLIVIALPQGVTGVCLFWAALWLGALPSMFPPLTEKLDPARYQASMRELVQLSGVRAIIAADATAPLLAEGVACPVWRLADLAAQPALSVATAQPAPDEVAFLQHSSGTTGLQKGVALSHAAVLNQLASLSTTLKLTREDVIVSWLPLYHDMGLIAGFLLPLIQGVPLVLMSPFDWVSHPALLLRAIHTYRGTLCWLPNFAYNHLAQRVRQRDSAGLDLRSVRAFINCSEPVRAESHSQFIERFAENGIRPEMLAVSYAMAENVFAVTQTPPGEIVRTEQINRAALQGDGIARPTHDPSAAITMVSCGPCIANSAVKVVGEDGQPLPERRVGEVLIRSDCMLTGYYRRPDLTVFDAQRWVHTGDRGYLAEGEVFIVGRSKDLIINAGKNLYPQDLEVLVNAVMGVHPGRAVVFGVYDVREGTELIAVVAEVESDDAALHQRLKQQIRQQVARGAEVTVSYVTLVERGWLIKTSSGKIARSANRDKWLAARQQVGEGAS